MDLIEFKHAVVARIGDGKLLLALIDGDDEPKAGRCVGIILCRPDVARATCAAIGSALKDE